VYVSNSLVVVPLAISGLALCAHSATVVLSARRMCDALRPSALSTAAPPVSIKRPVSGLTLEDERAHRSTFALDYPDYEVIICAEREHAAAVHFYRALLAQDLRVPASILIGRSRVSANPKLDNIEKGWDAARHAWVIMSDCNVQMPVDYIQTMLSGWREDCVLVGAPPAGI
jgi:ceramide glucosyltransferase